jgi:hypothetical protein
MTNDSPAHHLQALIEQAAKLKLGGSGPPSSETTAILALALAVIELTEVVRKTIAAPALTTPPTVI